MFLGTGLIIFTALMYFSALDNELPGGSYQNFLVSISVLLLITIAFGAIAYRSSSKERKGAILLSVLAAAPLPLFIYYYWTWKEPHFEEQIPLERSMERADSEKRFSDAEYIGRQILEKHRSGYFVYGRGIQRRLSLIFKEEKKFDEAIEMRRSAVQEDKETNQDLRELAADTQDLARAYSEAKRYSEAVPFFEAAIEIYRRDKNLDDYYAVVCRKEYAKVLRKLGKSAEAQIQENEAEKVLKRHCWAYPVCPEEEKE